MTVSRTSVAREATRRMRRLELQIGEDVRRLRLDAGLSLTNLAEVVGVHRSHIARIEGSQVHASLEVITAIGVALGADLNVRYFAGSGPRLHDRFQALMVEVFLRCLHHRWNPTLEMPVGRRSQGVIDVVLQDRRSQVTVAAEAQSELRRLEEQIRWQMEKADALAQRLQAEAAGRNPRDVSRLLILRSTIATRELARRHHATLSVAYPARSEDVYRALTSPDTEWPGAGIIWMRVDGNEATLLRFPPRGVAIGR